MEIENLESKSIGKPKKRGGARKGSGRKKGQIDKTTLERLHVLMAYKQRILKNADKLFNAQNALAQGVTYLYRVDETGEGKNKKREHILVTEPDEIKEVLDETDGAGGTVNESYYYITTKQPDNKAIDSLLDRVFGKSTQVIAGIDDKGDVSPLTVDVSKMTAIEIDKALADFLANIKQKKKLRK